MKEIKSLGERHQLFMGKLFYALNQNQMIKKHERSWWSNLRCKSVANRKGCSVIWYVYQVKPPTFHLFGPVFPTLMKTTHTHTCTHNSGPKDTQKWWKLGRWGFSYLSPGSSQWKSILVYCALTWMTCESWESKTHAILPYSIILKIMEDFLQLKPHHH